MSIKHNLICTLYTYTGGNPKTHAAHAATSLFTCLTSKHHQINNNNKHLPCHVYANLIENLPSRCSPFKVARHINVKPLCQRLTSSSANRSRSVKKIRNDATPIFTYVINSAQPFKRQRKCQDVTTTGSIQKHC